jgi:hypothetical protein
MSWRLYRIRLSLQSAVHAGSLPVGNILKTRPYVSGKSVWGAVTAGLVARHSGSLAHSRYSVTGYQVRERLRFGYFFPMVENSRGERVPDFDSDRFEYEFLDSYTSTALNNEAGVAEENSLHEIEVIRCWSRPVASDRPWRVHLVGHLAVEDYGPVVCQDDDIVFDTASIRGLLSGVQLGGKRGYGFGRIAVEEFAKADNAFGGEFDASGTLRLPEGVPAAAHIDMEQLQMVPRSGRQEPFVGREWREHEGFGAGQFVSEAKFCWAPGAVFECALSFRIGHYGVWESAA